MVASLTFALVVAGCYVQYQRVLRGLWLLDSISQPAATSSSSSTSPSSARMDDDSKSAPSPSSSAAAAQSGVSARVTEAIECFVESAELVRAEWWVAGE